MKLDLLLKNGTVVFENDAFAAHIGVRDGKIVSLFDQVDDLPSSERMIDALGKIVLPGAIEPHCHFWDPGEAYREGWDTGTKAAVAGGFTSVVEMPLSTPPTVDKDALQLKLDIATEQSHSDFALWGGIVPDSRDNLEQRIHEMDQMGAAAYKVFMCWSAQTFPPIEDGLLHEAMALLSKGGQLIGIHAENESIIKTAEATLKRQGRADPMSFVHSRPPDAELEAIHRALFYCEVSGARTHIVHMSLADGAKAIRQAKDKGVDVSVETTPQYLTLTYDAVVQKGAFAKCAPPLRSRDNVQDLWAYVLDGTIDFIGSDHAPFTREEKETPASFWDVPNGIPGLQESFSILLSEGVNKRGMGLNRLAELTSTNVAKRFRLYPRKGAIRLGADADLIIVNPDQQWVVRDEDTFYKVGWTPYNNMRMKGRVEQTIIRGTTVYENGEIRVDPGFGRFVRPRLPLYV